MHGRGLAAGGPRRPRVGSVPIGLRTEVLRVSLNQLIQRGISAWEREDYETALATFREVLDENPGFADIQNKAGLCMAMLGDVEGALGAFDAALALNPGFAEAHLNRGIMLNELGDHDAGQEAFAKAGELDTRDGTAFPSDVGNQIAVTHAKLGDLYLAPTTPLKPPSSTTPRSGYGRGSWTSAASWRRRSWRWAMRTGPGASSSTSSRRIPVSRERASGSARCSIVWETRSGRWPNGGEPPSTTPATCAPAPIWYR